EDQGAASRATQPADASASKSKPAASTAKRGQSAAGTARAKSEPPPAETKTANAAATKPSPSKQDAEPQKDTGNATGLLGGAAPTAASVPGTEDQPRANEIRQRIVPSVRCRSSSIVCLSEPPVAVLVFFARAAGTGLVAANLAPA